VNHYLTTAPVQDERLITASDKVPRKSKNGLKKLKKYLLILL
jgi:hypothetical protein